MGLCPKAPALLCLAVLSKCHWLGYNEKSLYLPALYIRGIFRVLHGWDWVLQVPAAAWLRGGIQPVRSSVPHLPHVHTALKWSRYMGQGSGARGRMMQGVMS